MSDTERRTGPIIECSLCHQRIQSKHRHDWVPCKCGETFVDGGNSYLRVGGFPVFAEGKIKTFAGADHAKPLSQAARRQIADESLIVAGVTFRGETPGLDALREADFRRNVGLLLRDVTDYIEAMTALCAALRAGGRTPEAQLKTLDRLSDVPMRALAIRAALAPDTEETL